MIDESLCKPKLRKLPPTYLTITLIFGDRDVTSWTNYGGNRL